MAYGYTQSNKMGKPSSKSKTTKKGYKQYVRQVKDEHIKKIVKSELSKELETKFVCDTPFHRVGSNSSIVQLDMIRCLPKLVQDEGKGAAYERLGTKVIPRSLAIHCHVSLLEDLNRSTAITVFWYVLEAKRFRNLEDALSFAPINKLMRTGNGQQYFPFDGNSDVAMLPINNVEFKVIKKGTFNLGKNTGMIQDDTTAGNQPIVQKVGHRWTVKIPTPKTFIYEQDENSPRTVYYPNNFAPFLVCGYIHQDQSIPDSINTDMSVTAQPQLYYDDA